MQISVIGAGVSGLTCAVALRRAGFDAQVIAAESPTQTTSMAAAAVWTVPGSEPNSRAFSWSLRSREVFAHLAADPASGVVGLRQRELEVAEPAPLGWKADWIRPLTPDEIPSGYRAGWMIDGYRIDPETYLGWLSKELERLGGNLTLSRLAQLDEGDGLVVNCTGLGARELCQDLDLVPIRGQVVLFAKSGIDMGVSDENDPGRITYVYPRNSHVVLGGTRQMGDWNLHPDRATTDRILSDCLRLEPRLAGGEVLGARVGLRPGRHEVRLEQGRLADGRPVIHNYGHGGMGYIFSWGCAEEVTTLAHSIIRQA